MLDQHSRPLNIGRHINTAVRHQQSGQFLLHFGPGSTGSDDCVFHSNNLLSYLFLHHHSAMQKKPPVTVFT